MFNGLNFLVYIIANNSPNKLLTEKKLSDSV